MLPSISLNQVVLVKCLNLVSELQWLCNHRGRYNVDVTVVTILPQTHQYGR